MNPVGNISKNDVLYQVVNRSGKEITKIEVYFKFSNNYVDGSGRSYAEGLSPLRSVSVKNPLKDGESIDIRVNNFVRKDFHAEDVKLGNLIGLQMEFEDSGHLGVVESDKWDNHMTIETVKVTRMLFSGTQVHLLKGSPTPKK